MIGKCLCESVQFEIFTKNLMVYQSHCSLCRRQTGTNANLATFIEAESFQWIKGQGHIKTWRKSTGFRVDFCINCGSGVPNAFSIQDKEYIWLPIGLLDETVNIQKVAHFSVSSKASWDEINDNVIQYQTLPNDMPEFIYQMAHTI